MTTWVIRAGRDGADAEWCLAANAAGGRWQNVGSLAAADDRDTVKSAVDAAYGSESSARVANWTGQLWALRHRITPGDLIVMPQPASKTLALGTCTEGYRYDPDTPLHHLIAVDWHRDDVPRSALAQDLLNTLGAISTVFQASRNEADSRLHAVAQTGVDPWLDLNDGTPAGEEAGAMLPSSVSDADVDADLIDPVPLPTIQAIQDRVMAHVAMTFREHDLTHLVADILRARGFTCDVAPPGPDQGVDILAGSGPLGLDSPTLIVEVKSSPVPVGAPVVRGLQGAMLSNRSDQGLLVAWGGITKDAKREIRTDRLTMRVWDAQDLLDHLFDVYEQLPETTRAKMPLKQAWVLDEQ